MSFRVFLSFVFAFVCAESIAAQDGHPANSYVAKVGDVFITEREFVNRFEMLPGFGRHQRANLERYKAEFLYTMIAEKLLAQEAHVRNLDRDTSVEQALFTIRKRLSRDELYRREISQKIKITEKEIIQGMVRARSLIFTSYLYFPRESEARFVRGLLKKPRDFESLKIDSSISFLRDTATVIWGDADPQLEDAVYRIKKGEITPVIKAEPGFFIAKVIEINSNGYFASMPQSALREHVADILRLRKERRRLNEYVSEVLKDKKGYSLPKTFALFARALLEMYSRPGKKEDGLFSSEVLKEVQIRCADFLNDTLSIVGDAHWTLNEVIGKLTNKFVNAEKVDSTTIPYLVNRQIQVLVQQELLEQEALRRGLDKQPSVKEKIRIWQDAVFASRMKEYVKNRVTVSESEIHAFLKNTGQQSSLPQVRLRQLKTASLDDMMVALNEMHNGMKFEEAVSHWSIDSISKASNGLTEFFSITEHSPVGEIAWQMEAGQAYGPIAHEGGYLFFEVIEKKEQVNAGDTSFANQYQKAKKNLMNMKAKQIVNRFLAQVAQDRGIAVYEERLKLINVTSVPMMTFRVLGFGGKMLEVPFVDPQLDWLNIEPPKTKVLP